MVHKWELDKIKDWTVEDIKNCIWLEVDGNQHVPGCVSVEALRMELKRRGEEPVGYHNT